MFPTLDVVHDLGYHEHIWAKNLETIIIIEEKLANDYFSDSLMETLREYIIRNDFSDSPDPNAYLKLSNRIRAIEFPILRTGEFPIPSIIDAVNFIRTSNKDLFKTGNSLTPPDSLKTMDIKIKNKLVDIFSKKLYNFVF